MDEAIIPKQISSQNKTYKVLKQLGEGGTSVVYLVEDGKRKLALKILGGEVDPTFKERYIEILKNEFEILSRLKHPNIASVYDFEYCPELKKYFFTTEYIEGTDILTFTEDASFEIKEELFVQFLNVLEYVHKSGLIHCDIKCANILVTIVKNDPVIKLVDFGFATRHLVASNNVVGTLHYLAPEVLLKMDKIDSRVDIYAAGIVFYKLLHRKYPTEYNTLADIIKWHQNRPEFSYATDLPAYVKQLISRMTAIYPSDRFTTPSQIIAFINDRTEGRYKKILSKIAGLIPFEGVLVGRDDIIKRLSNIVAKLKEEKNSEKIGILFSGQQGIGKSRIIQEIKYRAELAELPVKEILCDPSKNLVNEFISQFKDIGSVDLTDFDPSKPDASRAYKLIQWISDLISAYEDKGLIIFIDDFQLSNEPFADFIREFEKRLLVSKEEKHSLPIFLVITSRPKDTAPQFVRKWLDATSVEKIDMSVLSVDDIKKYAETIGIKDFEKHRKDIMEFSGGVPQLVEAYCHHIITKKGVARPPASLTQSYLERTRSLSNRAGFYLKVLSVAHRNLTIDEIAQIVNDEQDLVVEVLNELILFSCVKKDFNSLDVSVENKALSQVVRDNLVVKENKEISRSLGEWCEIHEPDSYVELARYFKSSEIIDKAKKYILDAAKKLEKAYNCSEAIRYYEMAKDYCNNNNEELTQLTRSIAKLNVVMGRYTEAAKEWERLDSDSKTILEDYLGLGSAYAKMHNFEKAKSWYEKGLGRISDETAIADIVKFKNNLGNIYFYMGDFGNSEKYFTEAIGDATICLLLDNNLGLILNAKGQYKDAVNFYETRKRYLEAKDDKRSLALCYAESGYIHTTNNHFEEAISDFEKSYDLSSQIDEWHNLFIVLGNLIRIYQQLAKYTKALEAANKSLKMEGRLGSLEDLAQTHLTVGILYESLAVFDLAEQHIDMARDRFIATNNEMMIGWCYLTGAYLNKDAGNIDKAFLNLDQLDKLIQKTGNKDLESWESLTRAELYLEQEKYKEAIEHLEKIVNNPGVEFLLRKKLTEFLLKALTKESVDTTGFESLLNECDKNSFLELKWEIYAGKGRIHELKGENDRAIESYLKAREIIESIASGLVEAYRDSYKQQRSRLAIIKRFMANKGANVDNNEQSITLNNEDEQIQNEQTTNFSKSFEKK